MSKINTDKNIKLNLFTDIIKSISNKTGNVLDEYPDEIKTYNSYIVNRHFSFLPYTCQYVNYMNLYNELPLKMQYDFYYYALDKGNNWVKWQKKIETDAKETDIINIITEEYSCSKKIAKQYLKLLNDEDIEKLKKLYYKGETKYGNSRKQ